MRPSKRFDRLRIDWFAAAGSGMRDRLELLRTLREARWPLTATLGTALLLQALLPAATAVTMAVLVGTLEQHGGTAGLFGRAVPPLGAFAAVMLLGHVVDAAAGPLHYIVKSRIDGAHRAAVARLTASTPTVAALERQQVRDLIRVATADPDKSKSGGTSSACASTGSASRGWSTSPSRRPSWEAVRRPVRAALEVRQPALARAAPMRRSWAVAPPRANSLCLAATK